MTTKVRCQDCRFWSLDRVRKGFRICQVKNHFINPANQPRYCRQFKPKPIKLCDTDKTDCENYTLCCFNCVKNPCIWRCPGTYEDCPYHGDEEDEA